MKKHILVVDDESDIREMIGQFLSLQGFRTSIVASPLEAEKVVGIDPPDLIISDLQLEDSDGLRMIERLKAKAPKTPIILLTGVYFEPEVVRELMSKTITCYFQKTTPLSEIVKTVRRLTGANIEPTTTKS